MTANNNLSKQCLVCGRVIEWRAKWSKNWNEIKYCSKMCRNNKKTVENNYEQKIILLLTERSLAATICPSEVLPVNLKSNATEMELVRQAARRLVHQEKILILQKNKVVNPSDFRGPIRLKLIQK